MTLSLPASSDHPLPVPARAPRDTGVRPQEGPAAASPAPSTPPTGAVRPVGEVRLGAGVAAMSRALGTSEDDLVERLVSGSGIADLLGAHPGADRAVDRLSREGVLADGYA